MILNTESPMQSMLSAAEEISGFGYFNWDMVLDKLEWSDGLLRIFGIERSEFSGRGEAFFRRIHPEDKSKIAETIAEASRHNGQFRNTERILRPNGEIRWLESLGRLISDSSGAPQQLVGVCRDITESVESANELRRQIDERKTLEKQLLQAQKAEAIGRLTSGIAHDFNNLLTVINSGCQLLNQLPEQSISGEARSLIQSIKDAGERATQLTEQLLLYSRSSPRQPQSVDLNEAIEESREFLDRLLGESIKLSVQLTSKPPVVRIDPTHLQQVLLNLAVNAKDAMPDGGAVSITTNTVLRSQIPPHDGATNMASYAILQITDIGSGIDEDVRLKIFDPFFTTKPIGSGTGLGLSVIYGIVNSIGGFIEVDSQLDQGTEFRIFMPLTQSKVNPPAESEPKNSSDTITVLVVDDEPAVMEIVSSAFRQDGYQVIGLKDSVEAARFVAQSTQSIDLLVTDVSMPILSGPELVRAIQGDRTHPPFPVLYLSGNDQHALANRHGINIDSDNFLKKPFRISALFQKTQQLLSAKQETTGCAAVTQKHQ